MHDGRADSSRSLNRMSSAARRSGTAACWSALDVLRVALAACFSGGRSCSVSAQRRHDGLLAAA